MNNGLENLIDDYLQEEEQDFAEEWMWVAGMRKDLRQFSTPNYTFRWASKQSCLESNWIYGSGIQKKDQVKI